MYVHFEQCVAYVEADVHMYCEQRELYVYCEQCELCVLGEQ